MERWVTARTALGVTFERATDLLIADPVALLPSDHTVDPAGRLVIGLSVETKGGAGVRHRVAVTLGAPCSAEGETWMPIEWSPVAHSTVLPSFSGVLEIVDGPEGPDLAITGIYEVPLGVAGRFGDGLLGRRVAQQSIRNLLDSMARQLRKGAADDFVHSSWKPAPYPISLRERPVPDPARRGPV